MGRAEKEIIAAMRASGHGIQTWSTSKIVGTISRSSDRRGSEVRQISRAIGRAHVIPAAMSLNEFLIGLPDSGRRMQLKHHVEIAQSRRMQVSIVQLKEVRMGIWALLWNNLRLARHWIWVPNSQAQPNDFFQSVIDQFVGQHRLPACLLIHRSANEFRDHLLNERKDVVALTDGELVILQQGCSNSR